MKRVTLFVLSCLCVCFVATAQPLKRVAPEAVGMNGQLLKNADDILNQGIKDGKMPGAVLAVVRHGKMAYIKAYGNRRVKPTIDPMTTGTIFDMASCTKPLATGLSIMKLMEQGKLRLSDPVSDFIPGYKDWVNKDSTDRTTIRLRHVLTHTTGLPAYASVDYLQKKYGAPDPKGLLEYICNCSRNPEPGTYFRYSCLNFITLQNVVQNITGKSLREFAQENIYKPLGLTHTDFLPCRPDDKGYWVNTEKPVWAKYYKEGEEMTDVAPTEEQKNGQILWGQVHDPLARVMNGGISGNAGLFTTADDIAVICAMIQNGGSWNGKTILSPATIKTMRTVPESLKEHGRALGWDSYSDYSGHKGDLLSRNTICHTGYTGTSIVIDQDNDLSIIILTNAVHPHDKSGMIRIYSLVSNAVAGAIIK